MDSFRDNTYCFEDYVSLIKSSVAVEIDSEKD